MNIGARISGVAHLALIAVAMLGLPWMSRGEVEPVRVSEVSFVSEAELAAAMAAFEPAAPAPVPAPAPPPVLEAAPVAPAAEPAETAAIAPPEAAPLAEPAQEAPPALSPPAAPPPPPARRIEPVPTPPPPDVARPAETVVPDTAPDPVAAPEPEPEPAPEAPLAAAPEPAPEAPEPDPAPEPEQAVVATRRPLSRRENMAPPPVLATPEPELEPSEIETAAAEPAQEATPPTPPTQPTQTQPTAPTASTLPVGPPLTVGEKDGLRFAIQQCWNVPAGLRDAGALTVTVGAELAPDGQVIAGSIRLIEPQGALDNRFDAAFRAARIALARCAPYTDLPRDKYAQWRQIEVVFNPEGMVSW